MLTAHGYHLLAARGTRPLHHLPDTASDAAPARGHGTLVRLSRLYEAITCEHACAVSMQQRPRICLHSWTIVRLLGWSCISVVYIAIDDVDNLSTRSSSRHPISYHAVTSHWRSHPQEVFVSALPSTLAPILTHLPLSVQQVPRRDRPAALTRHPRHPRPRPAQPCSE